MFACSDAAQTEIEQDIREQTARRPGRGLLLSEAAHLHLPRGRQARRTEPVRIHTGQHPRAVLLGAHRRPAAATQQAISLVKAGIARTRLTEPLEPIVVETTPEDARHRRRRRRPAGGASASPTSDSAVSWSSARRSSAAGSAGSARCTRTGKNGRALIAELIEGIRSATRHHCLHRGRGRQQVGHLWQLRRRDPRRRRAPTTDPPSRSARSSWRPASTPTSPRRASSVTASTAS